MVKQIVISMDGLLILQGHFDAIIYDCERIGGNGFNNSSNDFEKCIVNASLIELRTRGWFYIWTNN